MPLPADDNVNQVAQTLLTTLKTTFGTPPGFRPGKTLRNTTEEVIS